MWFLLEGILQKWTLKISSWNSCVIMSSCLLLWYAGWTFTVLLSIMKLLSLVFRMASHQHFSLLVKNSNHLAPLKLLSLLALLEFLAVCLQVVKSSTCFHFSEVPREKRILRFWYYLSVLSRVRLWTSHFLFYDAIWVSHAGSGCKSVVATNILSCKCLCLE